jgi:hypothetical protein
MTPKELSDIGSALVTASEGENWDWKEVSMRLLTHIRELESQSLPNEMVLRKLLWFSHNPDHLGILYGDDGEMQCGACFIDFKRMSAKKIEEVLDRRALANIQLSQSLPSDKAIEKISGHHIITKFLYCPECGGDKFDRSFGCWNCGATLSRI